MKLVARAKWWQSINAVTLWTITSFWAEVWMMWTRAGTHSALAKYWVLKALVAYYVSEGEIRRAEWVGQYSNLKDTDRSGWIFKHISSQCHFSSTSSIKHSSRNA